MNAHFQFQGMIAQQSIKIDLVLSVLKCCDVEQKLATYSVTCTKHLCLHIFICTNEKIDAPLIQLHSKNNRTYDIMFLGGFSEDDESIFILEVTVISLKGLFRRLKCSVTYQN